MSTSKVETELAKAVVGRLKFCGPHYVGVPVTDKQLDLWVPYVMATVKHETAGTFKPINEFGTDSYFIRRYGPTTDVGKRLGNLETSDATDFKGRGYVQITGRDNYKRVGENLGLGQNLVRLPHMALNPQIALAILCDGMYNGWFTGLSLRKMEAQQPLSYSKWRRMINGMDKAEEIAKYARDYRQEGFGEYIDTINPEVVALLDAFKGPKA
jgi:hypothetical protein